MRLAEDKWLLEISDFGLRISDRLFRIAHSAFRNLVDPSSIA